MGSSSRIHWGAAARLILPQSDVQLPHHQGGKCPNASIAPPSLDGPCPAPRCVGRLRVAARERASGPAQSAFPPCPTGCPATVDVVLAHISAAPGRANCTPDLVISAPAHLPGLDRPASQTPPSHRDTSVPLGFATTRWAGAVVRSEQQGPAGSRSSRAVVSHFSDLSYT